MKKISMLKTLQIIILIALLFQIIYLFIGKGGNNIYQIVSACLIFGGLFFAFVFSGKLEQEKMEREKGKKLKLFLPFLEGRQNVAHRNV